MNKSVILGAALAAMIGLAGPATAGPEVNAAPGGVLVNGKPAPGLAVHGYDVVAYYTAGKPTIGMAKYAVQHGEATYRFSSQKNLDAFKSNPSKYEPAYGGYCAYGVSVNAKFDGDPRLWKIVDGKLYLNLNPQIQKTFEKDVAGNIKKADANWPAIADKHPSEIK